MDVTNVSWGVLIGILGSILSWIILTHIVKPKLRIKRRITLSHLEGAPHNTQACMHVKNYGKREVIDLKVVVRYAILGLLDDPKHYKNIDIATGDACCVSISSKQTREFSFSLIELVGFPLNWHLWSCEPYI